MGSSSSSSNYAESKAQVRQPMSSTIELPDPALAESEAVKTLLTHFINKIVLIHIPDGRAFRGRFLCVDNGKNVILSDTDELRIDENYARMRQQQQQQQQQRLLSRQQNDDQATEEITEPSPPLSSVDRISEPSGPPPYTFRWVGMVMIPGEYIRCVELESPSTTLTGSDRNQQDFAHPRLQGASLDDDDLNGPRPSLHYDESMFF
ncbi:hypothetical protein OC861_003132 [Tilletia horrida]|nr:hypothetical protein OC861_003132 [Tilletia horrida]